MVRARRLGAGEVIAHDARHKVEAKRRALGPELKKVHQLDVAEVSPFWKTGSITRFARLCGARVTYQRPEPLRESLLGPERPPPLQPWGRSTRTRRRAASTTLMPFTIRRQLLRHKHG